MKDNTSGTHKLVIFYIDPQSMSNLAVYDYNLLEEIKDFDIHYICSVHLDHEVNQNHTYHKLFRYNHLSNPLLKACSYVLTYLKILFLIRSLKPKLIHVQWFRLQYFDYVFFKIAKWLFGFKMLYTAHNILPLNTGNKYAMLFHKIYHMTDHIIVHSADTKRQLEEMFALARNTISVIHHGYLQLNYNSEKLAAEAPTYRQKYPFEGKTVFTSLGFQIAYKGSDIIANVWASTPQLNQNPHCLLVLVGKNHEIDYSQLSQYHNVIIDDRRISNEEYHYILSRSSVYLMPYRKASFSQSGALMTAIAEKTPALVTRVGGLAEPLELADIGWIIEEDINENNLRNALLHIMKHPEEITKKKSDEQAWEIVQQYYDWHRISLYTQELYHQIIN